VCVLRIRDNKGSPRRVQNALFTETVFLLEGEK
jgi:hypothetical protein